jgi:hypothetical protein
MIHPANVHEYRKGVEPGFYVLTTNLLVEKAKVCRDTFLAALQAVGERARLRARRGPALASAAVEKP